jgi:site-specific recombinase XerD
MIRSDKQNIPTLREAVAEFVRAQQAVGRKSVKDHISVLQGATHRVVGKKAAGTALSNSQFGLLRCDRIEAHDLLDWFWQRHDGLAAATLKRGMSSLRGLVKYSIGQGYMDERVLHGLMDVRVSDSPAGKDWLYPERLVALSDLVEGSDEFDDYERFEWNVLFGLGTRSAETVSLQPRSLDAHKRVVTVRGKGSGDGKEREIPVDDELIKAWQAHIKRYEIGPNGWMLFWRGRRACGGAVGATEMIVDKTRPTSAKSLRTFMAKVGKLAPIEIHDADLVPEFSLNPKVARRTFACIQLILHELNRGGLDLHSLKEAMGHSRLDVTERYLSDVKSYLNLIRRPTNTLDAAKVIAEARQLADTGE